MSLRKRIILNAGSGWAYLAISAAVAIVLTPIIVKYVGLGGYGVWVLLAHGLNYVVILDRAFLMAISRFVAVYQKQPDRLNDVVSSSLMVLLTAGFLTILAAFGVSFFVADWFKAIPAEMAGEAQVACLLVGVTLAVRMIGCNFAGALQGHQLYTYSNGAYALGALARAALTLALLLFWPSIVAVQVAYAATEALVSVGLFIGARRAIATLRVNPLRISGSMFREIMRYTIHAITRNGGTVIMYNTLTLLIGWRGTGVDVAAYDIAMRLPNFLRSLMVSAQGVFLPAVSRLVADGQQQAIATVVRKGSRYSASLALAGSVVLVAFAEPILNTWLRGQVPPGAIALMFILTLSHLPGGIFEIWLPVLDALGHLRALSIASLATAAAAIAIALVLIFFGQPLMAGVLQRLGQEPVALVAMASAVALLVTQTLRTLIWLPIHGAAKLQIGYWQYLVETMPGPLLAAALSAVAAWGFYQLQDAGHLHWLLAVGCTMAAMCVIFGLLVVRQDMSAAVLGVRGRIQKRRETQG